MKIISKDKKQYILHNFIGQGAFGKVYSCPPNTKEPYAVKQVCFIQNNKRLPKKEIVQLRRQIQILTGLNHPNIVKLYDVIEKDDSIFLVLEKCDQDLCQYMKENKNLSQKDAISLFEQISKGLHYLHSNNIVHRDLKPANILMNSKKQLKIADFGFAKHSTSQDMYRTVLGTPVYMAPEIHFQKQYSMKCDIWSLGIIFYELLVHQWPPFFYKIASLQEFRNNMKNVPIRLPSHFSNWSQNILRYMVEFDENRRIGSQKLLQTFKELNAEPRRSKSKETRINSQNVIKNSPSKNVVKATGYPSSMLKLLLSLQLQLLMKQNTSSQLVHDKRTPTQPQLKLIKQVLSMYNDSFVQWFKKQYPHIKGLL